MDNLIIPIPARADLDKGIRKTYLDLLFVTQDNEAHRVDVQLMRGKNPAQVSGAGASAYFIRYSDNVTIPLVGQASGSTVSVTMKKACYNKPGQFALIVKATVGGVVSTVFYGEGTIFVSSTDKILDDENVIPTLDELLAQIAAMESASSRANTAADRVERMQIDASGLAGDANRLGGRAPEYYKPKQNLLDNSDFEVAEPGYVTMHGNYLYAADRWVMSGDGMEFSVSDGVKTVSSSGGYCRVKQYLWNDGRDKGKTYTLVLTLADGSRVACCDTSPEEDNTEQIVVAQTDFGNGGSILIMKSKSGAFFVRIAAKQAGTSVSFLYADLYEGRYTAENAPPHVPKGYAAEQAACRLHYRVIRNAIVQVSPNIQSYYRASSIFYEPMRAEPSVTIAANSNGQYGLCANVGYITQESDITIVNRENGCLGLATTNEAFAGRALQVYKIMLDAEPR